MPSGLSPVVGLSGAPQAVRIAMVKQHRILFMGEVSAPRGTHCSEKLYNIKNFKIIQIKYLIFYNFWVKYSISIQRLASDYSTTKCSWSSGGHSRFGAGMLGATSDHRTGSPGPLPHPSASAANQVDAG